MCKCIISTKVEPDKAYLSAAEGSFKKQFYNDSTWFNNRRWANDTILASYVWKMKGKHNRIPAFKWLILKNLPGYSNIAKSVYCTSMKMLELLSYPNSHELFNKYSELFWKCNHINKFLLSKHKNCLWDLIRIEHKFYQ